jgi:hypothetical protein
MTPHRAILRSSRRMTLEGFFEGDRNWPASIQPNLIML